MAPAAARRAPAARRRRSDVSRTIAYAVSSAPERAQDSGKRRGIIDPASISLAPASGIADSRRGERCSRRREGEGPANRRGDRGLEQSGKEGRREERGVGKEGVGRGSTGWARDL